MLSTPEALHKALIDWILDHGAPMGTFGPARPEAPYVIEERAEILAVGIDYERSTSGDLGGREWCHNTYDEAAMYPGLWAEIVVASPRKHLSGTWFVPGETHTLSEVILDILTATD